MEIEGFIYYFLVYKQRHPIMLLFTAYKRLSVYNWNKKYKTKNPESIPANTKKEGEMRYFPPSLLPSFITQIQRILILCHP